jgi:hypothetical protein
MPLPLYSRYPLDRRLVGPQSRLDDVKKRKMLPYWNYNSDLSVVHPVANRYTEYAIRAPSSILLKYGNWFCFFAFSET